MPVFTAFVAVKFATAVVEATVNGAVPVETVEAITPDADRVVKDPAAAVVPPIAGGLARYVENPVPLTVELAERVVNAPVLAVVAPTVPLILIEAVPVRLVTVPLEGVPKAPLNVTNAPAEPTLTPKAVATPVPNAVIPVPPFAIGTVPITEST